MSTDDEPAPNKAIESQLNEVRRLLARADQLKDEQSRLCEEITAAIVTLRRAEATAAALHNGHHPPATQN